jgi:Do/DeqQ family serine protease
MNRFFGAIVLGLGAAAAGSCVAQASVPLPVVAEVTGTPTLAPMLKKITPAVVSISIKGHTAADPNATVKNRRDAKNKPEPAADHQIHAAGSGVVIDANQGIIITNNHVIDHADEITVTLSDGRELPAKLIGTDPDTDVAVIKVTADNLTVMPIADSDKLEVGDFVLAIGNPFLIGQTVTSGIVSGLRRNNVGIEEYEDFIQTDAAIYPGNSGGALINLRGELVGINTAFIGATSTNPGMGFAIPMNMARNVVDHIMESGDARRGRLGITFEDLTPALSREWKLTAMRTGTVITKVEAGSAAEHAGLKGGDVVTEIGRTPIHDTNELRSRMGLLWMGDTAEFTVLRDGQPTVIRAVITGSEVRAKQK